MRILIVLVGGWPVAPIAEKFVLKVQGGREGEAFLGEEGGFGF